MHEVHRALRRLPAQRQRLLLLTEFSGLRGEEIARLLGVPAGTVASRRHTAIAQLRAIMGVTTDAR